MKEIWIAWILATESTSQADDQVARSLRSIHLRDQAIRSQLMRLPGFSTLEGQGSSSETLGQGASPERSEKPLFVVHGTQTPLLLTPGKLLFGRLLNRLIVGTEGSPALVELDPGQGALSGFRVLGHAQGGSAPGRISAQFQRLLLPGGRTIPLQAMALDDDGAYGIPAEVVSHRALSVLGAIGGSFISGWAGSQGEVATNALGFPVTKPSRRESILQGLSQTGADQSKRLLDEATQEKPVLIAPRGAQVTILIQEEVRP